MIFVYYLSTKLDAYHKHIKMSEPKQVAESIRTACKVLCKSNSYDQSITLANTILYPSIRDKAIHDIALDMAKKGDYELSRHTALTILESKKRDDTLRKISEYSAVNKNFAFAEETISFIVDFKIKQDVVNKIRKNKNK